MGHLYTKLPKNKIKERMDHFKELAKQLIKIRNQVIFVIKKIGAAKGSKKTKN